MKILVSICTAIFLLILIMYASGFAVRDMYYIKSNAGTYTQEAGFSNCFYQGYEHRLFYGGMYWYQCDRNNTLFQFALIEWNNEIHLYNLSAIDALSNNK